MRHSMTIRVRTEWIDAYPELLESYKRQMNQALIDLHGVEADWVTFTRIDGVGNNLVPEWENDYTLLEVESK